MADEIYNTKQVKGSSQCRTMPPIFGSSKDMACNHMGQWE